MPIYRGRTIREFFLASLLYDSILDQDKNSIVYLLKKGADANIVLPTTGISPFHLVIGNDCANFALEITKLILQHNGNPNVRSDEGITPVHIASAWNRLNVLELLLLTGGDPEICDINYNTPIDYALGEGFTECYNLLCSYKNDKNCPSYNDSFANVSITLDKIIINNGLVSGEYDTSELEKPKNNSITSDPIILNPNTLKYVEKWCNNNQDFTLINKQNSNYSSEGFSSFNESDSGVAPPINPEIGIKFKKRFRKTRKINKNNTKATLKLFKSSAEPTNKNEDKESGIFTLLSATSAENFQALKDNTSDYFTSSFESNKLLPEKIVDNCDNFTKKNAQNFAKNITADFQPDTVGVEVVSKPILFKVFEIYKYADESEGVVLFEKRFLKKYGQLKGSATATESEELERFVSKASLPKSINYDTSALFMEIVNNNEGSSLAHKNLIHFRDVVQIKMPEFAAVPENKTPKVYSSEIQKTLDNLDYFKTANSYRSLEEILINEFNSPDRTRKWRGGFQKASFSYLLLDPRVTKDLSNRSEFMKPEEIWRTFLDSIFYIGKGQKNRPYQHLYQAVKIWKGHVDDLNNNLCVSNKVQTILDIWADGYGVVCVHVFQNTIPVEAYTREALMISALDVNNLTNIKEGNSYGIVATWTPKEKELLGSYLLYKAMNIYLNEGERQLCPEDI